jgi:hypothetical protein
MLSGGGGGGWGWWGDGKSDWFDLATYCAWYWGAGRLLAPRDPATQGDY